MNEKEYPKTHHTIFFCSSQGVKHETGNWKINFENRLGDRCGVLGFGGRERLGA